MTSLNEITMKDYVKMFDYTLLVLIRTSVSDLTSPLQI